MATKKSNKNPAKSLLKQDKSTRFQPGLSGNPAGRIQGSRNKATLALESLMDGQAKTITQKAIDLALQGDTIALRLCLERICPPRKSRPVNIALPETKTIDGVAEAQAAAVKAVANGELSLEEATVISNLLEARRKAIETADHEGRIAALENVRN